MKHHPLRCILYVLSWMFHAGYLQPSASLRFDGRGDSLLSGDEVHATASACIILSLPTLVGGKASTLGNLTAGAYAAGGARTSFKRTVTIGRIDSLEGDATGGEL